MLDTTLAMTALERLKPEELLAIAKELEITDTDDFDRPELVLTILRTHAEKQGQLTGSGVLEIVNGGYGILRQNEFRQGQGDVYVSQSQIRRFGLRTGDYVSGHVRAPKEGERYFGLIRVEVVNDLNPETTRKRPNFENLTPIFPDEMINLEVSPDNLTSRVIDLVAPIGRGQRGLIVSPPKAGKTLILKQIANSTSQAHKDIHVMVLLIGERPEEVTDMRRSINGEVYSSTFDEPVEDHVRVADLALERARRLVEGGKDVLILLDSLTRLTRAHNLALPASGRTLTGGIDPQALYPPKRFLGAARNCEFGGSLTIVATCLIDTGSRMDDVIYEEFKGTGNMELHLDRKLAERRIYPAIDILRSGTRREELLFSEDTLAKIWLFRRMFTAVSNDSGSPMEGTERVLESLRNTPSNSVYLDNLSGSLSQSKGRTPRRS